MPKKISYANSFARLARVNDEKMAEVRSSHENGFYRVSRNTFYVKASDYHVSPGGDSSEGESQKSILKGSDSRA